MTWLTPKLERRVQIGKIVEPENDAGGFDFTFTSLLTVWMGLKVITWKGSAAKYIRGEQINENISHEFSVRLLSVASLGKAFTSAFSNGFNSISDLIPLKSEYYLFLQNNSTVKGRLFRIHGVVNNKEQNEYLTIGAEEIEERGTGFPA